MTADFATLLAFHLPRVHRAARGLIPDDEEAREIAQDALARAWAARERYDTSRPFYPWLYTIVRNACRDAAARRKHRAWPGLESERVRSAGPSPLSELSSKEARERVQRSMARLPEPQREVLVMRHFEDLSYAEIAELLDVPTGTVMSRLYRARKALLDLVRREETP